MSKQRPPRQKHIMIRLSTGELRTLDRLVINAGEPNTRSSVVRLLIEAAAALLKGKTKE